MAGYTGIDIGAETIKIAEIIVNPGKKPRWTGRRIIEHGKDPSSCLSKEFGEGWEKKPNTAITGRLGREFNLPGLPSRQARAIAYRFLHGDDPATLVSIGSHGFSVLELRALGNEVYRENSRCSQGTGNFLRQLVERFGLEPEEADEICSGITEAAPLSGRCPVILKTDMTHLANKGEDRARILAGLFDAVCENVETLIKPGISPANVLLLGGVSQSERIRKSFGDFLSGHGMHLMPHDDDHSIFIDALGAALAAAEGSASSALSNKNHNGASEFERIPPLSASLGMVRRMPTKKPTKKTFRNKSLILGFDMGSTGSKLIALDPDIKEAVWESYIRTSGDPVGAAQKLLRQFTKGSCSGSFVTRIGITGSGREIVGSLLASCYGPEPVYILNEIAAHAEGALHFDSRVDTIFEIGGQDAKYIRLAGGKVIDAAMNEACSAGTGSFIEEQGRRFDGINSVEQLGMEALSAESGISLGQHCSVFMAEIIDEAVAMNIRRNSIIAGIYDSIIQNYLNRVKGSRSVGDVIFCQGMPFASDALAAAVAAQTGSEVIVPPNPGTVGALGIALLANREKTSSTALDPTLFLNAAVENRDTFICRSTKGCGGAGNRCRIDRISTKVDNKAGKFTWGGGCSLWDKGTGRIKLPDLAPDPFRERAELIEKIIERVSKPRGSKTIGMSDEFQLKELFPFFATYLHECGYRLHIRTGADGELLKRGIELANVPFCAPMQMMHGVAEALKKGTDYVFLPMLLSLPLIKNEKASVTCPIVQGSPDLLRHALEMGMQPPMSLPPPLIDISKNGFRFQFPDFISHGNIRSLSKYPFFTKNSESPEEFRLHQTASSLLPIIPSFFNSPVSASEPEHEDTFSGKPDSGSGGRPKLLSPIIKMGNGGINSNDFRKSCESLADILNVPLFVRKRAFSMALKAQKKFERECLESGQRALQYARKNGIIPVVVLGRSYTIHNTVLNSNVPSILREQGAMAIPVDCYPVEDDVPVMKSMFWGYGQRNLRAAHQIRRSEDVYSIYCSNYSCGPDSFTLHFYAWAMEGRPFSVIETDGHSGDAGTRTRVEAFLHCVREDNSSDKSRHEPRLLGDLDYPGDDIMSKRHKNETMLIPRMGPGSEAMAACMHAAGFKAEALPPSDRETVRIGRRYTSGKECLPMMMTMGSLLQRIENESDDSRIFTFIMPTTAKGPCRFGAYNLLHKITLKRLGLNKRVKVWSPSDADYFRGVPGGTSALAFTGFIATDLLLEGLYDSRPTEKWPGAADEIFKNSMKELVELIKSGGGTDLSLPAALGQVAGLELFGCRELLMKAADQYSAIKNERDIPTVLLVGEIYVRCDDFSNDYVVRKLEQRGIRVRFAPFNEWLEYIEYCKRKDSSSAAFGAGISRFVQALIRSALYEAMASRLDWPERTEVKDTLEAASDYLRDDLRGEAVLTVGGPVHEWREGHIDGVISAGPLECMPNKIAEAYFHHVTEKEGLKTLTLSLNGDPIDPEVLDSFAFEVHASHRRKRESQQGLQNASVSRRITKQSPHLSKAETRN